MSESRNYRRVRIGALYCILLMRQPVGQFVRMAVSEA
jgi:hypothetical protein